ncbi:uncharacterized protein VP01_1827g8 [Puccinia sorghi]|uniref:CCHC-type domain-containing protein n=1 Tax=Puccinia sorghi TaxID=27349 RepID=A0A0L6VDY3_9BASI|nr:uncharacterized protein VP01_1827g8 [Puccinia sorghi]
MDALNSPFDELMHMMGKKHAQLLATEDTLQKTQARLDATAGQQNPAPAPTSNPMVLDKPEPFGGTLGAAAKAFVGQIGLHAVTYPKRFPTNTTNIKRTRWVQWNLCFHCGQAGHISRGCLNRLWKPQDHLQPFSSTQLSKIQAEINCLHANPSASSPAPLSKNVGSSKNGVAQV